ncbi:MAG: hydrogenase maturation peptidase HycI [Candidatus Omnitrophota bacterium]
MLTTFRDILKGKVVIVGVGNVLKGDDSFGPVFVGKIKNKTDAVCIDAGTAPENYTGKITKERPDTILIIDVVHLDKKPGEWEILKKEDIIKSGFTTHDISPNMFIEYLEKETGADIYLLGVQPKNLGFGDRMSKDVKNTLKELLECMKRT